MILRTLRRRRRAFTLMQLIMMLPLFVFFSGLVFWAFRAQLQTRKQLARQADRHVVMRAVLNHLRADMAQATHVELQAPEDETFVGMQEGGGPPHWGERVAMTIHLVTPRGEVRYDVRERVSLLETPENTLVAPPPPQQTVIRTGVDGGVKEWSMFGQTLSFGLRGWHRRLGGGTTGETPVPQSGFDAGEDGLLDVRFVAGLRFDTGNQMIRRYDTTLRLGGNL